MIGRSAFMYGAVSATCLILHNFVMIFGDLLGWAFPFSIIISFCLSALTGYLLHSILTFKEPLRMERFMRYALAMSANIPLAFIAVWFWHEFAGLNMVWASPIATICMIGVNFVLSRWAILSKNSQVSLK